MILTHSGPFVDVSPTFDSQRNPNVVLAQRAAYRTTQNLGKEDNKGRKSSLVSKQETTFTVCRKV